MRNRFSGRVRVRDRVRVRINLNPKTELSTLDSKIVNEELENGLRSLAQLKQISVCPPTPTHTHTHTH